MKNLFSHLVVLLSIHSLSAGSVSNLVIGDTANSASWSVQANIQEGNTVYGDRAYTILDLPSKYAGIDWIRSANSSKSFAGTTLATFTLSTSSTVYIAIDNRVKAPTWLLSWENTGDGMATSDGQTFSLFQQSFAAGTQTLGPLANSASDMYIVMVRQGTAPAPTPVPPLYNVKTYGAVGNGSTDDTVAVDKAVSACNAGGGGTVVFSSGTYSVKNIHLKNYVSLYLDSGSKIVARSGQDNPETSQWGAYQDFGHTYFHNALIWGENLIDIKIWGKGTIDGNTKLSTADTPSNGTGDKAIALKLCTNVEIGGVDINNQLTAFRGGHFFILATGCDNVNIHDIYEPSDNNSSTYHRDFLDVMECNNVTVKNITVDYTGDDIIKLGSDYSLGYKRAMNDVKAANITGKTKCNVCMIGSETVAPISNVSFSNITVKGAGKAGVGIMSNDGSAVDSITVKDVVMNAACSPFYIKITNRGRTPNPVIGSIKNVTFTNITATNCYNTDSVGDPEYIATVAGYENSPTAYVQNVTFNNVKITAKGGHSTSDALVNPPELTGSNYNLRNLGVRPAYGVWMRYVDGITFNGCSVGFESTDGRYAVVVDNANLAAGVNFNNFTMQAPNNSRVELLNGVKKFYMHDCLNLPLTGPANFSGKTTF